ncbi:MAG: bifunctional phosphoribosylaminoimidazolecarboxamide formyltransferase/IMP cyclohydrolase [Gammaproteobacteria bacterium]|nr:bifunctional phosphoribosylaminoimidazolecarboxamide formyltransferase/IMP cyclohydrolase [Gammaproteobacteria bacterium]
MRKALISVTNKSGIAALARELISHNFEILSTGGTASLMRANAIEVTDISSFTGSPEMLNGRVKTLHPRVFGGILGRPDQDAQALQTHNLDPIALVVVNLYAFEETIGMPNVTHDAAIEAIDIGGVALIRAAAKNSEHVLVVVDPADYAEVRSRIQRNDLDLEFRHRMAAKAFRHTAAYDAAIANYLSKDEKFPERLTVSYKHEQAMRYGENPHQEAAFYLDPTQKAVSFHQIQGKTLSFNNIADTHAAWRSLIGVVEPACAIVKHANPCGFGIADHIQAAYDKAFRTDPTSAFGGIIAFNRELDGETLEHVLANQFAEVIVAPKLGDGALASAKRKKSLRLLTISDTNSAPGLRISSVANGALVQESDLAALSEGSWDVKTKRTPTRQEEADLRFAWHVVKHVKSNAIVFARDGATTGIGAGQPNRMISVRIAAMRMQEEGLDSHPCVLASDAFFPFRDGIDRAAEAGITAVIQPGGSIRDGEVIQACDEHGMAMVATGIRHFLH